MDTKDSSQQPDSSMSRNCMRNFASGDSKGSNEANSEDEESVIKKNVDPDSSESGQIESDDKTKETCDNVIATTTSENALHRGEKADVTSSKMCNDMANSEDIDNNSEMSDFSDLSQESWHPVQGPIAWVQEQMRQGHSPRKILEDLIPAGTLIPDGLDPIMLWKIIINIVSEPPKRKKLDSINTLDDVVELLKTSKKIMVLTGAGVSVSCGIPDFRSRDGVYARLSVDFPNLPDPQAMFDIHFFRNDPRPFFKFAKEIYPGQFHPSPCHHFIRLLETKGKLLRNYTQNIDTLEQVAGIQRVIQCHGSFATATCAVCGLKVNSDSIKEDIFQQVIPLCPRCPKDNDSAVMKPDIVFFGESLPEDFHSQMAADKDECDLLIVIGSSLKVRPVALIPSFYQHSFTNQFVLEAFKKQAKLWFYIKDSLPAHVPQILLNRERLHYLNFDVELLGNCDDIIGDLCRRLGEGWEQLASPGPPLKEVDVHSLPTPPASPQQKDSFTSIPVKKTCQAKSSSPCNDAGQLSSTSQEDQSHFVNVNKCVNSSSQELKPDLSIQGQTSSPEMENRSSAETMCSHDTSAVETDSSQNCCKTGSINCGITPHHTQDVMFCPGKGAPHLLTEQHITKCSSDTSQTSSEQGHHHHHHHNHHHNSHHMEKRRLDSCEEENEPRKKQKLSCSEHPSEPGGSSGAAENKSPDSPEGDSSLDEIRKMWKSRRRQTSLAQRLSEDQVLFLPPCRYVFKGAEVYSDDDVDSDDSSSSESEEVDEEEEEEDQQDSRETMEGKKNLEEQTDHCEEALPPHPDTTQLSAHSETPQPSSSVTESSLTADTSS